MTQEPDFADAFVLGQNLGEGGDRPSPARQLCIEYGESGRQTGDADRTQLIAAPDGRMGQQCCQGRHRVLQSDFGRYRYFLKLPTTTPAISRGSGRNTGYALFSGLRTNFRFSRARRLIVYDSST